MSSQKLDMSVLQCWGISLQLHDCRWTEIFLRLHLPSSTAKITSGIQAWGYSGKWDKIVESVFMVWFLRLALFGANDSNLTIGRSPCKCPVRLLGHYWWRGTFGAFSLSPFWLPGVESSEAHTTWELFRSIYPDIFFPPTDVYRLIGFDRQRSLVWWERPCANKLIVSVALINDAVILTAATRAPDPYV